MRREAIDEFKVAIRVDPSNAEAHFNLGMVFFEQGDLETAIREFREAINLDPNNVQARYRLALAFIKRGRYDRAVRELYQVLEINPDDARTHYYLGVAYNKKDDIVHSRLMRKANQLGLPLKPRNLKVFRDGGLYVITAEYTVPVDFSVWETEWTYTQREAAPIF